jgi:hypothetical protein
VVVGGINALPIVRHDQVEAVAGHRIRSVGRPLKNSLLNHYPYSEFDLEHEHVDVRWLVSTVHKWCRRTFSSK